MSLRRRLTIIALVSASLPAFAQAKLPSNADKLQRQCGAIEDYSKLPQTLAKQCEIWKEHQEQDLARTHLGGILEADEDARKTSRTAAAQVKPLLAKLTPAQRFAYVQLEKAFQQFLDVQVSGGYLYLAPYAPAEWDNGGEFASEYLHAHFDMAVTYAMIHRTDLPGIYDRGPADDLAPGKPSPAVGEADAKLNAAWKRLESDLVATHQGPSFAKLKIEQRAWLKFRDAFVSFAVAVSPTIPASIWIASLETTRAEALSSLDSMIPSTTATSSSEGRERHS